MGLLKTALIGAAVYGAIKYITKKDELTGRSMVDEIKDNAPEWMDKAKNYKEELSAKFNNPEADYIR